MAHSPQGGAARRRVVPLAVLTAGFAAAAAGPTLGAAGVQVDPLRFDARPVPGVVGRIDVANPSAERVTVTLTPRRWRQASNGTISPDMRNTGKLRAVRVSTSRFSLRPGQHRLVTVGMRSAPAAGYLYANVLTRAQASGKGKPVYQVASSVHMEPARAKRRFAFKVSSARAGRTARGTVVRVAVRNLGNMVNPMGGSVLVKGGGKTFRLAVPARGILPKVRVQLRSAARRLKPGRYTVKATISQRGSGVRPKATSSSFRVSASGRITR